MIVQRHNPAYRLAFFFWFVKFYEKKLLRSISSFLSFIYTFLHNIGNDILAFQDLLKQIHDQVRVQ